MLFDSLSKRHLGQPGITEHVNHHVTLKILTDESIWQFCAMVTKNATMHGGGGASHGEKQHGRIVQFLECPFVENGYF